MYEFTITAIALLGDFGFLAGQARDFLILVLQNESWGKVIEACYGENCRKVTRYAFKKETGCFDFPKLESLVKGLPKEYQDGICQGYFHPKVKFLDNANCLPLSGSYSLITGYSITSL